MKTYTQLWLLLAGMFFFSAAQAQKQPANLQYNVSMENAAAHYYHVELKSFAKGKQLDFKICAWTPGYYQILQYAKAVENFKVTNKAGEAVKWEKPSENVWRVQSNNAAELNISYDVKAIIPFVGDVYLDEDRGYITPGGLFLYLDQELRKPVTIKMQPYSKWPNKVYTGLDTIPNTPRTFIAADYDVLYDSPFLMGNLEELPQFTVEGKPHHFIGYKLPAFDRQAFMNDLKKIVESGSGIIGDIPYTHYSFLAIGQGGGGIEHLNSTSLSFGNGSFSTEAARKQMYNFIAHEYFHHYNVKRIRPIELGPFDYSKENHTNMLWVSEGFTVYYEYLTVRRAGLMSDEDMLKDFQGNLKNYENQPGHLYQSATQASYNTWGDGPSGRVNDDFNKTISYYDKGPILGLMLDFNIRHVTKNKKSLDDVMRLLYTKYYKQLKRGFTEKEFQAECEKMAGTPLPGIFEAASTVKPIDYPKYFAYAGLNIDTVTHALPASWVGMRLWQQKDTLRVVGVDYQSPAFNNKIRIKTNVLMVDGEKATGESFSKVLSSKKTGDTVKLLVEKDGVKREVELTVSQKKEKSFTITPMPDPDALQAAIYKSWTTGR